MSVFHAIRKAERVLPGKEAPDGELDPRWQAIIGVADHIEQHPDEVWRFTRKWGAHVDADLRTAVATCLLEHLLEYHFDRMFPLVSEACRQSRRFADTFSRCGEFGQTYSRRNVGRFRALQMEVRGSSANKALETTPGNAIGSASRSMSSARRVSADRSPRHP
jgi:hypothetical protein